jgi:hypothetical protein
VHKIAKNGLIILGLIIGAPQWLYAAGAGQFDPATAAKDTGITNYNRNATQNLMNPMTSDDQVVTPDGTAFDARLTCVSSQPLLRVTGVPGAAGEINPLLIEIDTTGDGLLDTSTQPPVNVSGVCANGVIACNPGTWNNCTAYKWQGAPDTLQLTAVPLTALGGCYCINDSCGTGLAVSASTTIMKDLGGGIIGAFQAADPRHTVTKSEINNAGFQATYYGQDSSQCGSATHANAPGQLQQDAQNLINDPQNYYHLIADGQVGQQQNGIIKSCKIERLIDSSGVTASEVIRFNGGAGRIAAAGNALNLITVATRATNLSRIYGRCRNVDTRHSCYDYCIGPLPDMTRFIAYPDRVTNDRYRRYGCNNWQSTNCGGDCFNDKCNIQKAEASYYVQRPDRIISATLTNVSAVDNTEVLINGVVVWSNGTPTVNTVGTRTECAVKGSTAATPNTDVTQYFQTAGPVTVTVRAGISTTSLSGQLKALIRVVADTSCEPTNEHIQDGCYTMSTDDRCSLKEEAVDGVVTITNYAATHLDPMPSSRTFSCSNGNGFTIQRDWWLVERSYYCTDPNAYDVNMDRLNAVTDSADGTTFNDPAVGDGLSMVSLPDGELTCPNACRVRRESANNEAGTTGPQDTTATPQTDYEYSIYECSGDSNNICPTEPGETVVDSCQCLNMFGEAVAAMQSARMASQDMICTQGPSDMPTSNAGP